MAEKARQFADDASRLIERKGKATTNANPIKCFRIPEDLYRAALAKAGERDETVSQVVRLALERYVETDPRPGATAG